MCISVLEGKYFTRINIQSDTNVFFITISNRIVFVIVIVGFQILIADQALFRR